jgi:predicted helicase
MATLSLKPTHKPVQAFYTSLAKFEKVGAKHEGAVRAAFQELLDACAGQFKWKVVGTYALKRKGATTLFADGALLDDYGLVHGIWEAKDTADDLDKEIKAKFAAGYPKENILFQEPKRAVLYQNGQRYYEADLTKREDLVHVLTLFLEFAPPAIAEWEKAVDEFKEKVPQLGASLSKLIKKERQTNPKFKTAFADFLQLCRASLNPNLSEDAVEEMIIQHLLTERIFRKIFSAADFIQRNVIAQEIEKVIAALTSKAFSRDDFLKSLDHFYVAIEHAADTIKDFSEKQKFLNTVYERFFQGFSVKVADTHGIVYTPQPLVNFMVNSVEHLLKTEFGTSLADKDVHILDPFTGTGNFIVNLMRHIPRTALPHKYRHELHCNEVMLLPYYVAAMNIEHEFFEAVEKYEPFEGICLVDTFETAERAQGDFEKALFNEANAARVERQKKAPIKVIIANPPYNAGQVNENDNNKNRKYPEIDRRVKVTYAEDSQATLLRKLSDPYVKAIRYATDRIGEAGVVCYVNNDSFVDEISFDGMRRNLVRDFDVIYVLELGGNVRKNPKLSGTTHNVFGIQVGVSINFFVRLPRKANTPRHAKIYYHAVPTDWRREEKYEYLEKHASIDGVKWRSLKPDKKNNWLTNKNDEEFGQFLPVCSRDARASGTGLLPTVFRTYSLGVSTNRDDVVYDFDTDRLATRVEKFVDDYNAELHRWRRKGRPEDVDNFVNYEHIKWSRDLKLKLQREIELAFDPKRICDALYRPFIKLKLYGANPIIDREGTLDFFRTRKSRVENRAICLSDIGLRSPFSSLAVNLPSDLHLCASTDAFQTFPFFTYSKDGTERRDNVTLQALTRFQIFYDDDSITRQDIFHYVYALLHHPAYRSRYAENLKRELPRIPFVAADGSLHGPPEPGKESDHKPSKKDAAVFHAFAKAGEKVADLHVNYEAQKEFKLQRIENKSVPLDWRVEAMKLTKDRTSIIYNDFFTFSGIPPEVFDYKLGNRSALEWVIDQYRVTRDEQGTISDPNRDDDEQYIVRLIGQVITVSLETQRFVKELPSLKFE